MMKKIFTFFVTFIATTALWAGNVITYKAASKLPEVTGNYNFGLHTNAFNVAITSHEFADSIGTITFAGEVTNIGEAAFYNCTSLSSITIPNSVTCVGERAFSGCTSLPVENNLRYADTYLVETVDKSLSTYIIKEGTKWIREWAFSDCISLSSITIPNGVTSIGHEAFYRCKSLTSITISNSVTSIGERAFFGCTSLTSIDVDPANTHYSSIDGVFFNYAKDTLIQYPIGNTRTEYTIPNNVTNIGDLAFYNCTPITTIILPNSVTSIGDEALEGCISLQSITIPNGVTSIGGAAFFGCTSLTSIDVDPANTHYSSIDGVFFNYTKDTLIQYPIGNTRTMYAIPNSVTCIIEGAFYLSASIQSVTIPSSVTDIGLSAFSGCTSLPVVDNLRYADTYLVEAVDKSLSSSTIKSGTRWIGTAAFSGCTSLSSITIPNSVTNIEARAFSGCSSLSSIILPNSVTNIEWDAFYNCTSLSSITCFATNPPICDDYCFGHVDKSIPLYVPTDSISAYQAANEWKDFTNIQAIASEEVTEPVTSVTTTSTNNSITITWPTNTNADSYTIEIEKDDVVFCTHTFNAQGQLTNIAFAPGRGMSNDITMAEAVAGGYRFTITNLNPGITYTYVVDTQDAEGTSIAKYEGAFTTTGTTTALEQLSDSPVNRLTKIIKDGQLLILRDGKVYSVAGCRL